MTIRGVMRAIPIIRCVRNAEAKWIFMGMMIREISRMVRVIGNVMNVDLRLVKTNYKNPIQSILIFSNNHIDVQNRYDRIKTCCVIRLKA